jgi:beta-glucosidase
MKKGKITWGLMLIAASLIAFTSNCTRDVYKDSSKPVEERVEDLLKRMTLEEKLDLLCGDSTGFATRENKRLGIPAFNMSDGPLGVRTLRSTSFPAGVCMAATWDTSLINEIAVAMGQETRAHGKNYLLGPCVCIHRLPVGGRNFESYSEDPYLASRLAVSYVKGLQSQHVVASVKHFAVNDQEWERNNVDVIVGERALREIHLPAFQAAVNEGGAWSVMSAYNIVNGQHCSENYHLLKDILKGEWGFNGFVISDWVSVYSTANAANAGLDLEMPSGAYFTKDSLLKAIKVGSVNEATINEKVRRMLRAHFSLGHFDNLPQADTTVLTGEAHKKLTLKAAEEGIVLLKNTNSILPLDKSKIKSIAVIGPNANVARTGGGGSSFVSPYYSVSPMEGIKNKVGNGVKVTYAVGDPMEFPRFEKAIDPKFLSDLDGKPGLKGEYFQNMDLAGKPLFSRIDKTINFEWEQGSPDSRLKPDNFSVRWTGKVKVPESGIYRFETNSDDGVRLFVDGKKVIDDWSQHGASLDIYATELKAGKEYTIKLEYFEKIGGAVIQLGLDKLEKKPLGYMEEAIKSAHDADVAIVFAGANSNIESEGLDRENLIMPRSQDKLIAEVVKANPKTIVVLNGGNPVSIDKWINQVPAMLDMFYAGQETGNAIASILFGDVNPSGKLTFSFIKDSTQSPAFKGYKNRDLKAHYDEGIYVGYRYLDKNNHNPSYEFGYGLSYTSFQYSDLKIKSMGNDIFEVTLKVKNTGKTQGDEIAQLYLNDKDCSVDRPAKELKGFSRVSLAPGEVKTVSMKLNKQAFAFWDVTSKKWKVEPGDFEVLIGASSRDIRLKGVITVK